MEKLGITVTIFFFFTFSWWIASENHVTTRKQCQCFIEIWGDWCWYSITQNCNYQQLVIFLLLFHSILGVFLSGRIMNLMRNLMRKKLTFWIKRSQNSSFNLTGPTTLQTYHLNSFSIERCSCLEYWLWNYVYEHILKGGIKLSFSGAE